MSDLAETARRGYAVDDEEDTEGVACIGACVFDRNGQAAGAISVTGLEPRDWLGRQEALAQDVIRFAARISRQLGGDGAPDVEPGVRAGCSSPTSVSPRKWDPGP